MPADVNRLLQFIRTTCAPDADASQPVTPSTPLFSTGLIDSMALVELLVFIEKEFGVSLDVSVEELRQMDTATNLAAAIDRAS